MHFFASHSLRCGNWLSRLALAGLLAGCGEAPKPSAAPLAPAPGTATVRVAPNPTYARRSWWWLQLWGRHYRALWATPVTAPVLRLSAAGLQVVGVGGSFQTNTLRLRAPNGSAWVLRSVDKDLGRTLGTDWLSQLVAPVLRDQTCASPPYGTLVVAQLAQAAGINHTRPQLVYLQPDAALGPLAARFGPALYVLEERPAGPAGSAGTVIGSATMLRQLLRSPSHHLDARAYLRARLLDLLVGDWSRRADQWRWSTMPGSQAFAPLPRDRDQAFFRFNDGWLTRVVSWLRPRYQTFNPRLRPADVRPLTVTARALDHTALAWLPEAAFMAEADSLCRRLPDAVVAQALAAVPAEARPGLRRELLAALLARRAALPAAARRFYQVLQEEPVLTGTDAAERFELWPAGAGQLRLRAWSLRPARPDSLLGEQLYDLRRTTRLTVYGLGGNDLFVLHGGLQPGFGVHLHGGAGRNQFRQVGQLPTRDLTVYCRSTDAVQLGPDVRQRTGAGESATLPWLVARYRLGIGK